jgi:hypothetical protein
MLLRLGCVRPDAVRVMTCDVVPAFTGTTRGETASDVCPHPEKRRFRRVSKDEALRPGRGAAFFTAFTFGKG